MTPALGIDVSKDRLDVEIAACGKPRSKYFANSPDGWRYLIAWLKELKIKRVHACLGGNRTLQPRYRPGTMGSRPYRQHRESGPDPRSCAHQAWPQQN